MKETVWVIGYQNFIFENMKNDASMYKYDVLIFDSVTLESYSLSLPISFFFLIVSVVFFAGLKLVIPLTVFSSSAVETYLA